jgi:hypothetical protein
MLQSSVKTSTPKNHQSNAANSLTTMITGSQMSIKTTWYDGWMQQRANRHKKYGTHEEIKVFLNETACWITKDKNIAYDVGKRMHKWSITEELASQILGRYRSELARKIYRGCSKDERSVGCKYRLSLVAALFLHYHEHVVLY